MTGEVVLLWTGYYKEDVNGKAAAIIESCEAINKDGSYKTEKPIPGYGATEVDRNFVGRKYDGIYFALSKNELLERMQIDAESDVFSLKRKLALAYDRLNAVKSKRV